ncbi:MAG: single-stranded-DNA-specific exonuclease RecJ [Acidobacteriota bacterium]|nr:single-stranded-DNA-specific exonuclease RecJ [Acidobacteriota bacterium]
MRWLKRHSADQSNSARALGASLELPEPIAELLAARGIGSPEEAHLFLHPNIEQLHSPMLMHGMAVAVTRLEQAIARHEPMLIYGDYDVDGTMATVILKTAIELLGGQCSFHVPHRLLEGYGMRDEVIERAAAEGTRLIISVDTGIRAFAAAETAARVGVDLIVTDHHLVAHAEGVPKALAVLNPNQPECGYPCKDLCGAGVAFKVAQALLERAGRGRLVPSFLKIVAIATIADAVPLLGENRALAALGLGGLSHVVNPGLKALIDVCELNHGKKIVASDVAFRLAPRMNAAGRMDVASDVVDLFTVRDMAKAREIALRLNQLNSARQQEEQRISDEVLRQVAESEELRGAACMVVDGEGWHRGVIGICASRVVERFGRPAVVVARDGDEAHGSGRSIHGFHLLDALESVSELFLRYGGHAHAVGFAMRSENVPELRRRLNDYARARLTEEDLQPVREYDAELGLEQVTPRFWEALSSLQPFGMANPEPVFLARGARLMEGPRVMKEKHLKFKLRRTQPGQTTAYSRGLDALGWRMAHRLEAEPVAGGDQLDVLFRIEQNTHPDFGGGLQLVLSDFRHAEQKEIPAAGAPPLD